jgi:hypothetical protein
MRYHFFLHYGWFFQNLGKEAIRTFMNTTVCQSFLSLPKEIPKPDPLEMTGKILKEVKIRSQCFIWHSRGQPKLKNLS